MYRCKAVNVKAPGEFIEASDGIPDIFRDFINRHWQNQNGRIVALKLENRNVDQWTALGNEIMADFLSFGYVGLCIDGQLPESIQDWLHLISSEYVYGAVEIRQHYNIHPANKDALVSNTYFCSIQNVSNISWPSSLWNVTPSDLFHCGCDMILTTYKNDVIAKFTGWDIPMTISLFAKTLDEAVGWLIPLDENLGFILGIKPESGLGEEIE